MKVSRIKLLLINVFAIFAFLTILGIASPGKANALINENCSTTSLHFYNPTIIVKVIDHTGGNVRYSRDFSVFATALVNPGLSATTPDGVDQRTRAIRWDGKLPSPNAGSGISMRVNEANDGITSCNLFGAQVPALKFGGGAPDPRPILDCRYTRYNDGILHGLGFGIVADEVFDTGGLTGKWLPDETIVAQNGSTTFATSSNFLGKSAYTDYPAFRGGTWISVNGSQPTIVFTYQTDPPSSPVVSNINTLDCTLQDVRGYAYYQAFGASPVDIHVYVDRGPGAGVGPTWAVTANQPYPGLPVPGGHGFSFSPRGVPGINYTVEHTLFFYAANVPGNPLIDIRSMPSITSPPCNNRSFTIDPVASVLADDYENPTDVDVNVTFQLTSPNNVKGVKVNCSFFVDYYPKGDAVGRPNKSFGTAVVNEDRELSTDNTQPSNNCDAKDIDLTGPSYDVTAGDEICVSASSDPASGIVAPDGTIITRTGISGLSPENPKCVTVINKPYVSFYGGDVKVGGSHTGGNCTTDPKSKISAFSRTNGRGSGTQFAAYALGAIDGFNTAKLNTTEGDNYLTFPNSPNTIDGFGSFGVECTHDYSTDSTDKVLTTSTTNLVGLEGKYSYTIAPGNITITGGTIGIGQHVYIYADGDITITDDIDFADSGWANRNDIPVLYLVSKSGNIYIQNNVKKLFGVYSAQMGNINTCVDAGITTTPINKFTGCSNQLVVNGSFLAKKVQLNRTFGSLRNSAVGENPFGGANACDGALAGVTAPGNGTCAAEVFIFNPAFYIAKSPDEYSKDDSDGQLFDFYTNLPPFL